MSGEVNVLSRTQIVKVDPVTKSVSVINAGPQGPGGPGGGGSSTASGVSVLDTAGNFDGDDVEEVLAELYDLLGTIGPGDLTELEERVAYLESIGRFNMDKAAGVTAGTSDSTAGIQAIINYFGGNGIPIRLQFPSKLGYTFTSLDIPFNNIYLEGISHRTGGLICKQTTADGHGLYWHGLDALAQIPPQTQWTMRKEGGGTVNLRISTVYPDGSPGGGTSNTKAIRVENCTGMSFLNTAVYGFRGKGSWLYARNLADTYIVEPEADFCGNVNPERAVFDFSENPSGEWAVDRIRIWGGRLENSSGPLLSCVSGANLVNKVFMINTKIENQQTNGNGTGGSVIDGALFRLTSCLNMEFHALDMTLGGLAVTAMLGAPMPALFELDNCYGSIITGCLNLGKPGIKPFSRFFDIIGGSGITIGVRMSNNQPDEDCMPDHVFRYTGSPKKIDTSGTYWHYNFASTDDGGSNPPWTLADDSGVPASLQTQYDHKFNAVITALYAHIGDSAAHGPADTVREWRTDTSNDIGDGVAYSFTLDHNLAIPSIYPASITVLDVSTWWPINVDARGINANQVQIDFPPASVGGSPPGVKAYRVVVVAPRS